ncbi:MAG TPA: TetR/AcrR family transcriptional regulator [Vicinamibacterales bacterium]|jgi:AcrR family transcriptional regulator|nr:TetR/AcrR family transcriptional regulator [Vicinamibacterales bacterium]
MAVKRSAHPRERPPDASGARGAQRRRTRKAIVEATIALIAAGKTPSVNDVAAAADVSRRTVYMYFPTFDQLLIDATVGALSQRSVASALERESTDVQSRVDAIVRALNTVTPEVERLGRALIRLTVESGSAEPGAAGMPRRGYRRIEWIEAAVEPLRNELGKVKFQRLVNALAMVVGWEALIVQRDVCGLSSSEGEELSLWAARALVAAARSGDRSNT